MHLPSQLPCAAVQSWCADAHAEPDLTCMRAGLQAARQAKLAALAAQGVPAKYTAELAKYKPFKNEL